MTTGDPGSADATGLSYTDNFSITWRAVDHGLDDRHLAQVNASNEAFLRDLSIISLNGGHDSAGLESGGLREAPDLPEALSREVQRLDLKLNLVLDLVSSLVYRQAEIPPVSPVRMSALGLSWSGDVPAPGQTVFLELYLQRGLPKPLCCYAEVVSGPQEYEASEARVRFIGLCGATRDWLEKLIFRQHRRDVAFRRSVDRE